MNLSSVEAILKNPDVRTPVNWTRMLQADYWGTPLASNRSHKSYRPLTVFSFHLNHVMHGITPQGYHFVNIVLHGVATVLFTHLLYTTVFTQAQQGLSPELSFC